MTRASSLASACVICQYPIFKIIFLAKIIRIWQALLFSLTLDLGEITLTWQHYRHKIYRKLILFLQYGQPILNSIPNGIKSKIVYCRSIKRTVRFVFFILIFIVIKLWINFYARFFFDSKAWTMTLADRVADKILDVPMYIHINEQNRS